MRIQDLYAAIAATDMKASEAFYTTLFGRGPDDRPMNTLIQWRDIAGANVQVFLNDKNAGSGMMTIVAPDMDTARSDLEAHGLSLDAAQSGDFGRIAHLEDPAATS